MDYLYSRALVVCLLLVYFGPIWMEVKSVSKKFGRFGSVKVELEGREKTWSSNWPYGINLVNNFGGRIPVSSAFQNVYGYPYSQPPRRKLVIPSRTYRWQGEDLLISVNMTSLSKPDCTRLVPPLSWLSMTGSKVKVLQSTVSSDATEMVQFDDGNPARVIEITVPKPVVESSLSTLRMYGFNRESIFRLLDKGPWVLSFSLTQTLPKIQAALQEDLGLNQTEAVHVISHCPFLVAQYARYQGRDLAATARALVEVGYTTGTLLSDVMRFPSILSAPPERILGWRNLVTSFGIASGPNQFGAFLRKAPFMFNLNPPQIFDEDKTNIPVTGISTTASDYVVYSSLKVLHLLWDLKIPDLDKIIRTDPSLLLVSVDELEARINFLLNILSGPAVSTIAESLTNSSSAPHNYYDTTIGGDSSTTDDSVEGEFVEKGENVVGDRIRKEFGDVKLDTVSSKEELSNILYTHKQLVAVVLNYPKVLSVDHRSMADAANSLLEVGFSKVDVVKLIKRCPVILGVTPTSLKGCAYFLKQYCGLQKVELLPFVMKNPNILCMDITDLRQKVDYLFKSLGGSPAILRQFPSYLAYDLNSLIRPRAEFARAIEVDPLQYGLSFLLRSKTKDFAKSLEVEEKTFEKFRKIFVQKYKENDLDIINVKKKFKDTVYWEKLMRNQYGAASAEAIDRGNGTVVPSPIRTTLY